MNFYEQIFSRGRATGEGMTHFERLFAAKFGGSPPPEVREYTGAVPVTITADGTPLLDYLITGNTTQSGTPTHDNPVMPQGTGERTAQLFDKTDILSGYEIVNDKVVPNSAWGVSGYIPVEQGKYYIATNTGSPVLEYETIGGTAVRSVKSITKGFYTPSETARFIRINFQLFKVDTIMLNLGSTALPYEPFGVKIPISSNSTTTPVYLGEVETTRKIKKLVLTGEETIPNNDGASYNSETSTDRFVRDIPLSVGDNGTSEIILCTHLGFQAQSWAARTKTGCCIYCSGNTMQLHLRFYNTTLDITRSDTNEQRTEKLKAYLAQQYAAGTPVTVWYALANEETAVVNEPLMKIGDYADTLSKAQAGVSIPTNNGSTTVDVDTTVKPSEVYIKYMG